MHLDNPHLKKVSKSFDSIEPGDNVFFVELKLYNKHNGNYTCIRECYPNKRLAEMGLAFWRMHPGIKLDYYHSRTGVATHAMQCRVKDRNAKDHEPDTL